MNKDPFKEYIKEFEPTKRDKGYAWHMVIGLQVVDGLKTSDYLMHTAVRNIKGEISFEEANALLQTYYEENGEGNTRTTAVFFIKYLHTLGFDVTNDIFNAWYFRNSLVRANYNHLKNGIHETTEYLELFLRNLLLIEEHPLYNRTLQICGTFKEPGKANIDAEKVNIDDVFTVKTASHIQKLREALGTKNAFGRSDVQRILGLKPTRCSALLCEMAEHGIIEPVSGHGKGKYRFRL